jgi:hypothetical protein
MSRQPPGPAREVDSFMRRPAPVRTAVIGLGTNRPVHAQWCATVPGSELIAACDSDGARLQCVHESSEPRITLPDGLVTLQIIEAAYRAAASGAGSGIGDRKDVPDGSQR